MEAKAREAGKDEDQVDLVKLAALGNSRFKRLTDRQQDRLLTQKETAEAAERAATQAAQAAQAAQATAQLAQWHSWQSMWQSQWPQQGYYYYPCTQWGQGLLICIFGVLKLQVCVAEMASHQQGICLNTHIPAVFV